MAVHGSMGEFCLQRYCRANDVFDDGKEVEMENDTGVVVSVMTHTEYKRLCNQKSRLPLHAARINWKTYTGGTINIYGICKVVVSHQGDEERLPLVNWVSQVDY